MVAHLPSSINYVVHLGAISDSGYDDPDILMANTIATQLIAHITNNMGAKLVFFSSCAAINPNTWYGYSKYLAELFVRNTLSKEDYCIPETFQCLWWRRIQEKESFDSMAYRT